MNNQKIINGVSLAFIKNSYTSYINDFKLDKLGTFGNFNNVSSISTPNGIQTNDLF